MANETWKFVQSGEEQADDEAGTRDQRRLVCPCVVNLCSSHYYKYKLSTHDSALCLLLVCVRLYCTMHQCCYLLLFISLSYA